MLRLRSNDSTIQKPNGQRGESVTINHRHHPEFLGEDDLRDVRHQWEGGGDAVNKGRIRGKSSSSKRPHSVRQS